MAGRCRRRAHLRRPRHDGPQHVRIHHAGDLAVPLVVRPATVDDLDDIVELYAAVAEEGRWIAAEAPVDRVERRSKFESSILGSDASFFVAEDDGRHLGHVWIGIPVYGAADLGMMVAADARGRGIGSALLGAAIDWAREKGAHKVGLQVWPDNEAAIALYRKFGFEQEGLLRQHYRRRNGDLRSAVIMGLLL